MALIPTFTPREPVWRGNSSSADMNSNFEEILYDLNTIFEEASQQSIALEEFKSTLKHEVDSLNARLYAVSGMLYAFEHSASGYKMFHEEFYRTVNIVYPAALPTSDRCDISTVFGQVSLPVNESYSKVYTININTGEIVQAPDLQVAITPLDETSSLKVEETNPLRAFNGNNQSFWERKVRFSRSFGKAEVKCQLDVVLPSMSNPNVNSFYVLPYPEGTVDILSATYNTLNSLNNVVPTFPTAGELGATKTRYLFNDIQPVGFSLVFRQTGSAVEDNFNTFVYGCQEIGIEKVEYKTSGKIGVKFTLPSYDTGLLDKITSLTTTPMYDNIYYKVSLYANQNDFDAETPVWSSDNSPIIPTNPLDISYYVTDTLFVLIELTQRTNTTTSPTLDAVTVTYTTA